MRKSLLVMIAALNCVWLSPHASADPTYKTGLFMRFNYQSFATTITGINDSGQLVGSYSFSGANGPREHSLIMSGFDRNNSRAPITFKEVDLAPAKSIIEGISSNGLIAGFGCFLDPASPTVLLSHGRYGAVGSHYKFLPFGNDNFSVAQGINAKGVVIGTVGNGNVQEAFILQPTGHLTVLKPPGYSAFNVSVTGINDAGDVVGYFYPKGASPYVTKAFIRHANGTYSFVQPTYPHGTVTSVQVLGINQQGDMVGQISVTVKNKALSYSFLLLADGKVQYFSGNLILNGLDSADDLVGTEFDSGNAIILLPDVRSRIHK